MSLVFYAIGALIGVLILSQCSSFAHRNVLPLFIGVLIDVSFILVATRGTLRPLSRDIRGPRSWRFDTPPILPHPRSARWPRSKICGFTCRLIAVPIYHSFFTDIKLSLIVQYNIVRAGINTIGRMATIEETAEEFKKTIAEAAGLELKGGLESKIALSDLRQVWKAAQERNSAEMQAQAAHAASSGSLPMPVPLRDYAAMEWAHRQTYGAHI